MSALQPLFPRLYRETHGAFEDYCRERWGFSRRRADQMIEASFVVHELGTTVPSPANESQVRELARLPEVRRPEVWERAVNEHGEKVTAGDIRRVVEHTVADVAYSNLRVYTCNGAVAEAPPLPTLYQPQRVRKGRDAAVFNDGSARGLLD